MKAEPKYFSPNSNSHHDCLIPDSSIFSGFTKKYPLSKTLRFELKPVEDTKKHLKGFVESDRERAKDYKELKKIIDEYHKYYIEKSLSKNNILSFDDLSRLKEHMKKSKSLQSLAEKKENEKLIQKLQKSLRKQVVEAFQLKGKRNKKNKEKLFGKELIDVLLEWLDNSSLENIEGKKKIVEKFRKFTTYLTGFHENRKNMYSGEEQATAISYRVINENLPRFLLNLNTYEKITKNFPDLKNQFESLKEELKAEFEYFKIQNTKDLFKINFFNRCLTQTGIDKYNVIVGGKVLESGQKIQGINEKINLFRQAQSNKGNQSNKDDQAETGKISNKKLPVMQTLYKQILSDRESHSFYFEEFKSRNEVLESIDRYWESISQKRGDGSVLQETGGQGNGGFEVGDDKGDSQSVLQETGGQGNGGFEVGDDKGDSQSVLQETGGQGNGGFEVGDDKGNNSQSVLQKAENLFTNLKKYEWDKIYFRGSDLHLVSNKLFGDYRVIDSALSVHAENEFSNKKEREQYVKKDFFSFDEIQTALSSYRKENEEVQISKRFSGFDKIEEALSSDSKKGQNNVLAVYFNLEFSEKKYNNKNLLCFMEELYNRLKTIPSSENEFNEEETEIIQNFLKPFIPVRFENSDSDKQEKAKKLKQNQYNGKQGSVGLVDLLHLIKPVYPEKDRKKIMDLEKDESFYNDFEKLYKELSQVLALYNKVRNYITKNKRRMEKIKINFETSTLLDGWDVNKETDNLSVILRKKEAGQWVYYLGVMSKTKQGANGLFDYHIKDNDDEERRKGKEDLKDKILHGGNDKKYYEKMIYRQIKVGMDIQNLIPIEGKVVRKTKNLDNLKKQHFPPEIWDIKKSESYKKEGNSNFDKKQLIKFINYYKPIATDRWSEFDLSFKPSKEYETFKDFTDHIQAQAYKLSFDKIKEDYIKEKFQSGELYLFKIYSKDFSKDSKGRPNLHTSYFKLLFEEENLKDIIYKLNGQAEIFYRKASKQKKISHKAHVPIKNKNPKNPKKTSTFKYDLIKDKRFTEDKYFFHVPIGLNFKASGKGYNFNQDVLQVLKNKRNVNIIGIDRGERHFAYYTVINQKGAILEQGSFNKITTNYNNQNNKKVEIPTDYHDLLERKEKERDKSRKSWTKIENIKELKAGYLSYLVHQISHLMIKHNAIVIFEDLNSGFKRGRMKFEKQVYQKLEKALIDKLNYLVFKEKNHVEPGGVLNAYQLTAPFESFKKMGKQTGFIFYTPAYYTSRVCPLTGFVNLIYPRYENREKSKIYFKNFDRIYFDNKAGYFVFEYQDGKVNTSKESESNARWKVCTHGQERYKYNKKKRKHEEHDVTQELKTLFEKYSVDYKTEKDLRESIIKQDQKDFFIQLTEALHLTLQLRHINTAGGESDKKDFILSPVADSEGRFFDSRWAKDNEPKNADANGAYHIALKGLKMLGGMKTTNRQKIDISPIKNKGWFEFIRIKPFLFESKKAS